MAKSGGSRGAPRRAGKDAAPPRRSRTPGRTPPKTTPSGPKAAPKPAPTPAPGAPLPALFVLGAVPGATPGKWIDTWRERMPQTELDLRTIAVDTQRDELLGGGLDAALVRLPLDREGLHVIPLYEEQPVVVTAKDSHLTAADELDLDDLAGEIHVVPADDVLGLEVPGAIAPRFAPPETTGDAIATVAAGIGFVVVPMSLARLHQRRDAASIPLRGGPVSHVALAWPAGDANPLVEAFVGIVRGRTANSSRG